jgi:hypothetical protein
LVYLRVGDLDHRDINGWAALRLRVATRGTWEVYSSSANTTLAPHHTRREEQHALILHGDKMCIVGSPAIAWAKFGGLIQTPFAPHTAGATCGQTAKAPGELCSVSDEKIIAGWALVVAENFNKSVPLTLAMRVAVQFAFCF